MRRVTVARLALVAAAFIGVLAGLPGRAVAHDVAPGALTVVEVAPGRWRWRATPAHDGGGLPVALEPRWPASCQASALELVCDGSLAGSVALEGLRHARAVAVVFVRYADGRVEEHVVRPHDPVVVLGSDSRVAPRAASYARLGLEHVVAGPDHLLFVALLVLVGRRPRSVALAVTGFTVGHAISLGAVVFGVPAPPPRATEVLIAASVVLLARQAALGGPAPGPHPGARPAPRGLWLAALGFGLLHGLGFAGALLEIGLPETGRLLALAAFHIGVEAGQLGVVALLGLAALAARPLPGAAPRAARALAWAGGVVASAWTLERLAAWATTVLHAS